MRETDYVRGEGLRGLIMRRESIVVVVLIVICVIWFGIYIERNPLFAIATTLGWIGYTIFMWVIINRLLKEYDKGLG